MYKSGDVLGAKRLRTKKTKNGTNFVVRPHPPQCLRCISSQIDIEIRKTQPPIDPVLLLATQTVNFSL